MELVTGAIGSLLPKLGELLKEEYGLQKGVREKIQSLSKELKVVHAVLRETGDVPPERLNEPFRLWVRDLKEASCDMEDIVDTFLVRLDDSPEHPDPNVLRRLRKKVDKLFNKSKARRKISIQIQDVYKNLNKLAAMRATYILDNIVAKPLETIDPRLCNLYKMATDLVGIDGPRKELINKLSLGGDVDVSDKKMKVVSVVGFGGLGKTTLATAVYDQLKPHFECGAFVAVGQNPDMKKVFRNILIDLNKEKYRNQNMTEWDEKHLMDELKEFVEEKRCFIVIDDIWDLQTWELIISVLQHSNCGSRVVITTRISEVAAHAGVVYKMQALSHENSEKLLCARIVDGEGKYFDSPSAEACDKILKKCEGVPLAIITIASLLASKPGEDWSEVYNSIGFGHGGSNVVENTRKILSFSYYDLPSHLKPCLLYLSVFPEDHLIEKNSLIWKWIAEGFIHEGHAAAGVVGPFELGESYFNELINRSMIQPKETYNKGYIDACSVHDMVLDLIHSLSSEENFVTILDGNKQQKLPGSVPRRLALHHVKEHNGGLANVVVVDKVRSLVASQSRIGALRARLPVLRVLDIIDCEVGESCREGLLDHLGSMLPLRYLGITCTGITKLLGEVKYLKFLQTLDLFVGHGKELPEDVGLLKQLICLRASTTSLNFYGSASPGLIGKLTSLQELWINPPGTADDDVGKMQFVKELGMLRELRVFRTFIYIKDESMERALLESLGNLHKIRNIRINEGSFPSRTSVAEFVSHQPLQYLCLESVLFSGVPASIKPSLAPNLSYLELRLLIVKEQDMTTLGRLPELCCLVLYVSDEKSVVSIKIVNDGVGYFRKLRILSIFWASVCFDLGGCKCDGSVAASSVMPSLESLKFAVHVRSLKDTTLLGFEKLLGFESLGRTSLQEVTVYVDCEGACASELEEVGTVLMHAAAVHPRHPSLKTDWLGECDALSPYQEAFMDVSETPELGKRAWKLANVAGPGHIRALRTPDQAASSGKVIRLLYTNDGTALLALNSNAVHELWKWERNDKNIRGMSTTSVPPRLWQPKNGTLMTNDTNNGSHVEATACMAQHKKHSYLISTSGGRITMFDTDTFKVITTFLPPPPAATFLVFLVGYSGDGTCFRYDIIAVGREDSSIVIYEVHTHKVVMELLLGHQKKITGLAFSQSMNALVSSDADAQLCVWSTDGWEKKKSRYIQPPSSNPSGALAGDTTVQFHYDETHLLVVHESHLAVYDGKQLECLRLWSPRDVLPSLISSAVYASNGLLIYAGFCDGAIGIFEAGSLDLQCRVAPSAYIPSSVSSSGGIVVVAAHPWKPYQIAALMSDGAIYVLEPPLDTDGEVDSKASDYMATQD